jgi:hypothetical protein
MGGKDAVIRMREKGLKPESYRLQFSHRVFLPTYDGDVFVLGLA